MPSRLDERIHTMMQQVVDEAPGPPALPDTPVVAVRTSVPGWAVAAAAAALVLIVIGIASFMLGGSDSLIQPLPPVEATTTVVDTPTTTLATVPNDSPTHAYSVSTVLEAPLIADVAMDTAGLPVSVVSDFDEGTLYYGLWDIDGGSEWSVVRETSDGWETVVEGSDSPFAAEDAWFGPQILGIRSDGGIWLHDPVRAPEGPFTLWEYRDGLWIDHTDAAHLPGSPTDRGWAGVSGVSMSCCPMGMTSTGEVWVYSEDLDLDGAESARNYVSVYDGSWTEVVTGDHINADALSWFDTKNAYPKNFSTRVVITGVTRDDVTWRLDSDRLWTGTWIRSRDGEPDAEFPVDYATLKAGRTCSPVRPVLDAETESVITSDGALWTVWPCVGVTRIDPHNGSMTVITEGLPSDSMWRIAVGPDDNIWVGGIGGLAKITPEERQ